MDNSSRKTKMDNSSWITYGIICWQLLLCLADKAISFVIFGNYISSVASWLWFRERKEE